MITANERKEIIESVKADVLKKMKGRVIKEDIQSVLSTPREKWFRSDGGYSKSPMFNIFGTVTYWSVWEIIRKLVCYICGVGYVRHLSGNAQAEEVCEKLCQFVYDLRKEYIDESRTKA